MGSSEVEAIGLLTKPDFGDYWSPDDAFFDILRDKLTINAMVKDIAGKSCADCAVTDTAKTAKTDYQKPHGKAWRGRGYT